MNFGWLKKYMPKSLFGRAVLILLLPMIGLQLVVGQVFIQRHFQSVTEQMAASIILELKFAIEQVARAEGVSTVMKSTPPGPKGQKRHKPRLTRFR